MDNTSTDLINQLKYRLSWEVWQEFQMMRKDMKNRLKKEMNKVVENLLNDMTMQMETSYEQIVTRALNKLKPYHLFAKDNDNIVVSVQNQEKVPEEDETSGLNDNAKRVSKRHKVHPANDKGDNGAEVSELNGRKGSNGHHPNAQYYYADEYDEEDDLDAMGIVETDLNFDEEDELSGPEQNSLANQLQNRNGSIHFSRKRKIPKMQIDADADMLSQNRNIKFGICCTIPGCGTVCDFKPELDQHLLTFHGINPYVCMLKGCARSFSDNSQLVIHQNTTHSDVTDWICNDCSKSNETSQRLLQHCITAHYKRIFRCMVQACTFSAFSRREALRHTQVCHAQAFHEMKAARASSGRHFACPYKGCNKVFNERTNLRTHKRFHTRSKPFGCSWPLCEYLSEDRANAIRHIRVKHLKIPATIKEQAEKGIECNRDPRQWLQIYNDQF